MSESSEDMVPLTRSAGVALWRQIAQMLEAEIRQGVYPPGGQLPTEAQLAARFRVNRHTLRRAIASLQEGGHLRVEQGRGTFVQEETIEYPVARRTSSGSVRHSSPLASNVEKGVPWASCSMLDQTSRAFFRRGRRRSSTRQPISRRWRAAAA